jgi:hypothetical protein
MPIVHDIRKGLMQPALSDQLWRYMDFVKFMDMLITRKLYLIRVDKLTEFGDKHEGSFPVLLKSNQGFFAKEGKHRYRIYKNKKLQRFYYVNCWHGNDCESDAMWKVYVKSNQGIAIYTTVRKLKASLEGTPESMWLAKVQYPTKREWRYPPDDQALQACVTKRKSFKHEEEVRLIWHNEAAEYSGYVGQKGKQVKCDLTKLIEKIYLAPTNNHTENRWFKEIVKKVLSKYNIKANVEQSDLSSYPL